MQKTIFIICLLFISNTYAALFKITNRTTNVVLTNEMYDALELEVNNSLPDADQSTYLKGMANAAIISSKGLGADYSSNVTLLNIGIGGGLGADLGDASLSDMLSGGIDASKLRGLGTSVSANFGLNLGLLPMKGIGPIDFNRTNVYINFMSLSPPKVDGLSGEISTFGMHFQYKYITPISIGLVSWGGIDITLGYEYSHFNLNMQQTISQSTTDGATGIVLNIAGTANLGADIKTHSLPLEISSSVRLMYLFTLFGGFGMDFNFGTATSVASLTTTLSSTPAAAAGTGVLDLGDEGAPDSFTFRNFIGLQFNISVARIFAQLNTSMSNGAAGFTVGAKLAF